MALFLPIFPTRRYQNLPEEFEKIRDWIRRSLGKFNPWHVSGFVPHLALSPVASTLVRVLETARQVGLRKGLEYVYLENVYRHPAQNTVFTVAVVSSSRGAGSAFWGMIPLMEDVSAAGS
jgi:pyruvate-formate lyase-activating enzyme